MILFLLDSLFMHWSIVDVLRSFSPRQPYAGWTAAHAALQAFADADVEGTPNANPGLRPATSLAGVAWNGRILWRQRALPAQGQVRSEVPTGIAPWSDVSGSRSNWRLLQLHSLMWQESRGLLSDSQAVFQPPRVCRGVMGRAILSYADDQPPTLDAMTMQLAGVLDKRLPEVASDVSREGRTT